MIGTVLKVLGNIEINRQSIFLAVVTLVLLGAAGNAVYELLKLLPTLFWYPSGPVDWANLIAPLTALGLFGFWMLFFYILIILRLRKFGTSPSVIGEVRPHKGLVIALSFPSRKTPAEINEEILAAANSKDLHGIPSIGQFFKIIDHHRPILEHIWVFTTKDSFPYVSCLQEFLMKFDKKIKIEDQEKFQLKKNKDQEIIEEIKGLLSGIYDRDYLSSFPLEKEDVIVDVTGGTKTITIGMMLAALPKDITVQYVEQMSKKYDIIGLHITPEMIYDIVGNHLLELYIAKQGKTAP